jgi:hypothetical protein
MWTELEQRYVDARTSVVDDISLYLAGQNEEDTQKFYISGMAPWNATLR